MAAFFYFIILFWIFMNSRNNNFNSGLFLNTLVIRYYRDNGSYQF